MNEHSWTKTLLTLALISWARVGVWNFIERRWGKA